MSAFEKVREIFRASPPKLVTPDPAPEPVVPPPIPESDGSSRFAVVWCGDSEARAMQMFNTAYVSLGEVVLLYRGNHVVKTRNGTFG